MLELKLAEMKDFDFFYQLKCEASNMYWTGSMTVPKRENIYRFFSSCVQMQHLPETRKIYFGYDRDQMIGHIYIIPNGSDCDIPVAILDKFKGRGYGEQLIKKGLLIAKEKGFKRMVGHIREDNLASMKTYQRCGARITDEYIKKESPIKAGHNQIIQNSVKMYKIIIEL